MWGRGVAEGGTGWHDARVEWDGMTWDRVTWFCMGQGRQGGAVWWHGVTWHCREHGGMQCCERVAWGDTALHTGGSAAVRVAVAWNGPPQHPQEGGGQGSGTGSGSPAEGPT